MNGSKRHLLIVEDNDDHADLIRFALEESDGYESIDRVSNGQEAWNYLVSCKSDPQISRPDLILLDLNMPLMNGQELLKRLKEDEDLRTIPVLIMSTSQARTDKLKSYESHANSYLVKPQDFDQFTRQMKDMTNFWVRWNQFHSPKTESTDI